MLCHKANEVEVDVPAAMATVESWSFLRACTVDVAGRAALVGYASDRVGSWEISAQRMCLGPWPPGHAQLLLTLVNAGNVVKRWRAAFAGGNASLEGSLS